MAKLISNSQKLIKTCIEQDYSESTGYPNENAFFEFFAASQVLKSYNISDDEVENGIVGETHDGGCDALYVFLNGELLSVDQIQNLSAPKGSALNLTIIQAKETTSFSETVIMNWKTVSENLLDMTKNIDALSDRYNEAVREVFTLFRDALTKLIRAQVKLSFHYYYVSLATELHPNVVQQADELKSIVRALYPSSNVEVYFIDADKLLDLYSKDADTQINLSLVDNPITLGSNVEYVALVNLAEYYRFITDDNLSLRRNIFESNVRDYQGRNNVNSGIADTLENSRGEDFWWLNNGVTILAEKITQITTKELSLLNPEIVNGLQTSTEIYNYFYANPTKIENETRNVLIRIIAPQSEEVRDNIIYATNSQTSIPKSSLRVTDTIHLQIELYFKSRGLFYDRRKNYYKNQKKKTSDIVGVSFLAQCLISIILRKPDFARARPSTLLTDDRTYTFLYEGNRNLEAYYNAARIGKFVQHNLSVTQEMTRAEKSDILFYLLYAVVAKILGKKEVTFGDLSSFDEKNVTDDVINEIKNAIYERYKKLGGNGRVAKSETFINEIYTLLGF